MTKFAKFVAGTIVGAALAIGTSGVAMAAPVTSTTVGSPSTTAGTTGTTAPSTTVPLAPGPSTTLPSAPPASTTIPSAPGTAQAGLSRSLTRTAAEIWWIVRPHHPVDCARATQELKRVRSADAAAAKRLSRWSGKNSADVKSQSKQAAVRVKHASNKVRVFQKLEQDGQALIARIDAKCGSANSSK